MLKVLLILKETDKYNAWYNELTHKLQWKQNK